MTCMSAEESFEQCSTAQLGTSGVKVRFALKETAFTMGDNSTLYKDKISMCEEVSITERRTQTQFCDMSSSGQMNEAFPLEVFSIIQTHW